MKNQPTVQRQFYRTLTVLLLVAYLVTTFAVAPAGAMRYGAWLDEWRNAKTDFEDKTGRKKPAKKILLVFRKSSGIEKSLGKVDDTYNEITPGQITFDDVQQFEKAIKAFEKTKNKYIKRLDKAFAQEENPDSAYGKGLKILKTELKAIQASAEGKLELYKKASETGRVTAESFDAAMVKFLFSTIKNGQLFCKKTLAERTVEDQLAFFNSGVNKATRDVTQNLKNLALKMEDSDRRKKTGLKISAVLEKWGNQGRKLPDDANAQKIKKEVGKVYKALKDAKKWGKSL
jgi:hypothetical protein